MRLINTNSLELVEFFAGDIPAYAILSHRWGKEEVTFQDWKSKRTRKAVRHKAGYDKIIRACEKAKEQGLLYIWCDTNCIDKSSSAELSEAINSMWEWYHSSAICYAYLQDRYPKLKESEWFSRGWTLQELIAPSRVIFFSSEWEPLTTKVHGGVLIEKITNIPRNFLLYPESITNASVAKRMSWASRRRTTRVEDNAYCLLGMFGINMPLLYGEGSKAFQRLQEEIIRRSDDASILVWGPDTAASLTHLPLLAPSPICFRSAGNIELVSGPYSGGSNVSLSNRGLNLQ
ncbi:HET-domain-containing protein, partial [Hyaloscypha variabilis F]